jgi:hypothetical protein
MPSGGDLGLTVGDSCYLGGDLDLLGPRPGLTERRPGHQPANKHRALADESRT